MGNRDTFARLVVVALMAVASMAMQAPPASAGRIGPNHAPYWGEDCVKIDHCVGRDGATLVVDRAYRLVVLKSATNHDTFFDVRPGDRLTTGTGKGISHYILCAGAGVTSTPTTTATAPAPPTTTTVVPPTTTVSPTTTTTVSPTTTTVPDAEPATVSPSTTTVPGSVPTSTVPTTTVPATEPTDLTSAPTTSIPDPWSTPSTPPPDGDRPVAQPTPAESTPRTGASTDFKLAITGINVLWILVLGLGLIGLGMAMMTARRRAEPDVAGPTAD